MTYAERRLWLVRQRDGFEAELEGFNAAQYSETCPPHWYTKQPLSRQRFVSGFEDGKAILEKEKA